jgi:hypothetical protein
MTALALLSTLQSGDIVLPTTDGREIRLRRITEPDAEQKSRLQQLGFGLPQPFESNRNVVQTRRSPELILNDSTAFWLQS